MSIPEIPDDLTPTQQLIVAELLRIYGSATPAHKWHMGVTTEAESLAFLRTIPTNSGDAGMLVAFKSLALRQDGWPGAPEFPKLTSSGQLSPTVEYVALYAEGERKPGVVIVWRMPSIPAPPGVNPQMGSISGSLRSPGDAADAADASPIDATVVTGAFRMTCTFDPRARVATVGTQRIALGDANLVTGEAGEWACTQLRNVRTHAIDIPTGLARDNLHVALLRNAEVQAFVGADAYPE